MPTTSPRLGLIIPTGADPFDWSDLVENWERIDASPGTIITTVGGMASLTWGAAHTGVFATQTDTGLTYRWNGASFERAFAKGWLAGATRTGDLTEPAGTLTTLVQAAGVSVPQGNRKVEIKVSWSEVTGDPVDFQITRDATQLDLWKHSSGDGGSRVITDAPGLGSFTYALKVRTRATSSTVVAAADKPVRLDVVEV